MYEMQDTYVPPPAPKKRTGLILGLVALALLACCCGPMALIGYVLNMARGNAMVGCQMNIESARKNLVAYARATGKFPPSKSWREHAITKDTEQAKAEDMVRQFMGGNQKPFECETGPKKTYIMYNSSVAGKTLDEVGEMSPSVILYESPTVTPEYAAPYKPLPENEAPLFAGKRRDWITAGPSGRGAAR